MSYTSITSLGLVGSRLKLTSRIPAKVHENSQIEKRGLQVCIRSKLSEESIGTEGISI